MAEPEMNLYEASFRLAEKYGFGLLLSTAILWFVRTDIVLPMVAAHQEFLREIASTQQEISRTMGEQTRIMYALEQRLQKTYGVNDKSYGESPPPVN
jgi:hypothetical protein